MRKTKVALIGCGRIAERHARILTSLSTSQLTAVCDICEERARKYGQTYGVPWFSDYHKMLKAHPEIEAVCILTPSGTHAEIGMRVAAYRKHLIIEKPMTLRLDDADRLISECDCHRVKLMIVKQNRFNLPVIKLREAYEKGRFGKLVLGTVRVRWCRTHEYYNQAPWRGTWAMDGGVLANQASHHIDLLQWIMGPAESVFARTETMLADIEAEDTGVAILKFQNGALGVIEATTCARPKDLEGSISILGEKGTVEIGGFAMNKIRTWDFVKPEPGDSEVLKKYQENPPDVYGFGHRSYLADAIESIKNDRPALVDGLEGRKSLELINAIYESTETGEEIMLRFKPQKCRLGIPDKKP